MTTRYPKGNALVEYVYTSAWDRKNKLKTGDEVIVSTDYGRKRFRATITRTTDTQFTLDNGSRYSIKTGDKIGSSGLYNAPSILGLAKHTVEEADRINAEVVAAAKVAAQKAALADILDQIEKLAGDRDVSILDVFQELRDLNAQRAGEAFRQQAAQQTGE